MAVSSKWKNDPHSRNSHPNFMKNPEQENDFLLLEEPYAQALLEMDYKRQDILHAAKVLKKRQSALTAESILQEIMERENKVNSASTNSRKRPAAAANDHYYGSDGESDDGGSSMDWDPPSPPSASVKRTDLETDGEAVMGGTTMVKQMNGMDLVEPQVKKSSPRRSERELHELHRKLVALREENQRLRARQLCKKCRQKPVTITFLPCGHYSFCYECGQGFQSCPICLKPILADVRTFLA